MKIMTEKLATFVTILDGEIFTTWLVRRAGNVGGGWHWQDQGRMCQIDYSVEETARIPMVQAD